MRDPARKSAQAKPVRQGMNVPAKRIRITVGRVRPEAELRRTKTADEVYAALPIQAPINIWGEEFYFTIPGIKDHRETATHHVQIGTSPTGGGRPGIGHCFRTNADEYGGRPSSGRPREGDRPHHRGCDAIAVCVMEVPTIRVEREESPCA